MAISRKDELAKIIKEVEACKACSLCKSKIKTVFSRGSENAQIMLIGEAPGKLENELGKPFVGKSGQQLNEMLILTGFNPEEDIYFCNVVKCRPVKNNKDRKPKKQEIQACIKYLYAQIDILKPKIIVLCGNTAKNIFKINKPMKEVHGASFDYKRVKLVPVYHPRASISNEVKLQDFKGVRIINGQKK